jgi:hypothetical protein
MKTQKINFKKEKKMPKKTKLEGLKVKSFVTTLTEEKESQVKGGWVWESCPTCPDFCPPEMWTVECSGPKVTMDCL